MKRPLISLSLIGKFIIGLVLLSCNNTYRVWVHLGAQKIFNMPYGNDPNQKMDVFLPATYKKEQPIVLLLHGGAWSFGSKSHLIAVQKMLFENNIPTVNMDYRLVSKSKKITYKEQLEDINMVVEKMNTLLPKSNLMTNNYIILGESAGGHLALLYGYKNPEKIKKIISLSGPTDFYSKEYLGSFYSKYTSKTIEKVVGTPFNKKNLSEEYKKASPLFMVENVPTLIFQGDWDFLVNKNQNIRLANQLKDRSIPYELILLKNSGHTPRFFSKKKREQIIYPKILEWVR